MELLGGLIDELLAGISLASIDDLDEDALALVLWEAHECKPALVCRRWEAAVARAKIPKIRG
jgi:hypothetical protein